ncbi:methylated-DNA--protein-cysteine methyltransferase [Iodidimonas muriae]|uniref:Methylated-DNA--protein-cysteine methyltransferase n=1 Tax=Iodidimonas muriae TaxID=261467 RepID=A0ABQ2L9H2_9PROT|nr:methylated-DNA--[protein]-cysteine S-methyltransferase [Iodidimonas muriae]GER05963.1 methylated-DNA--protein-cysteine methyltransferase [Kordiimonadales bacterium JCM 17843]GGO07613.1 methylated-DNA--protein-cysteine methyltransferase [Iodidimonas muriae]
MPLLSLHSPLGDLTLFEEDGALVALDWGWGADQAPSALLEEACSQLHAYFDGTRTHFDLPFSPQGTDHQKAIWAAISTVPYGTTISYKELAEKTGSVARAVGGACGANPLPILIPCHRILAADGKLTGYSGEGGVETKQALLRLEGINIPHQLDL